MSSPAPVMLGSPPRLAWQLRPPGARAASLLAVGDLSLSGRVAGQGSTPIAERLGDQLRGADLAFANLECVLCGATGPFAAPGAGALQLASAGFDLLHLANNHALDYGPGGLDTTLARLRQHGISALGAGGADPAALVRTDRHGLRIGWLGAGRTGAPPSTSTNAARGPALNELDPPLLVEQTRRARPTVDTLIVSLHLGFMYLDYPAPEHRALAHTLAAAGADLVLVHHPHVLQPIEVVGKTLICYSLGNFLFDWAEGEVAAPLRTELQRAGAVFSFVLDDLGIARCELHPTWLSEECAVDFAPEDRARAALERLVRLGSDLGAGYEARYRRQRAAWNTALGVRTLATLARRGEIAELWRLLRRARREHLGMLLRFSFSAARERSS